LRGRLNRSIACWTALLLISAPIFSYCAQPPDVQQMIQKSVAANDRDFEKAPDFNYKERDRTPGGVKTYQVTMIDGSPYQRLIAVNGNPLPAEKEAEEQKKQQQAAAQRRSESSDQRQKRIAKYQRDRARDHEMMRQLTDAFNFTLLGRHRLRGFNTYVLKATPRPGYKPPNMDAQVLVGMEGQLWIDQKTYRWVKVIAEVIHPVTIEGFLATVEPGTQFEIEKSPVGNGIWQITHYAMRSNAKILFLVNRASQEDDTFFDFQKVTNLN
jgi:hypothetical protein